MVSTPDNQGTSTRPYLLRALHDWCTENGFTPYIAVHVDASVQVPMEYVKNNEIVLNVGFEATSALQLGNETIEFKARFGGIGREIKVPVDHVVAIYARENGQGMAFPVPADGRAAAGPGSAAAAGGLTAVPSDGGSSPRGLRLATADGDAADQAVAAPSKIAVIDAADRGKPAAGPKSVPSPSSRRTPARAAKDDASGKPDQAPPDLPPDQPPTPPPNAAPPSGRPSLKRIK